VRYEINFKHIYIYRLKKDCFTAEIRVRTRTSPSETYLEAESGSVWLEVYKNYGAVFKEKNRSTRIRIKIKY